MEQLFFSERTGFKAFGPHLCFLYFAESRRFGGGEGKGVVAVNTTERSDDMWSWTGVGLVSGVGGMGGALRNAWTVSTMLGRLWTDSPGDHKATLNELEWV